MLDRNISFEQVGMEYLEMIGIYEIEPLMKKMAKNNFTFISDGMFLPKVGKMNLECEAINRQVSAQLKLYDKIISRYNGLRELSLSEAMQYEIFTKSVVLMQNAMKFGYCDQAAELLLIIRNPQLVGKTFATGDASSEFLKILELYGQRTIIEGNRDGFKAKVDKMIIDAKFGSFGEDVRKIPQATMDKAYLGATVTKASVVFSMDGRPHSNHGGEGK